VPNVTPVSSQRRAGGARLKALDHALGDLVERIVRRMEDAELRDGIDQGEWKEKKITPELWQISYAVTRRRVRVARLPRVPALSHSS